MVSANHTPTHQCNSYPHSVFRYHKHSIQSAMETVSAIISDSASIPDARQKASKLADMLASASIFNACDGIAVDVVCPFMALLSFRGIDTPSLAAQGEQRRLSLFNIRRDNSSRSAPDARGQSIVLASAGLRAGHDRLAPRL